MPSAAGIAFWNRTSDVSADSLEQARLEDRTLVRMWGQRNTVHTYATDDWPFLHSAFAERHSIMRRRLKEAGLLGEFNRVVKRYAARLAKGDTLTYKDIQAKKLEGKQDRWVLSYVVFMELVREGVTCHGPDQGNQSGFVHREHWLPDLEWSPPDPDEAHPELARRYLAAYGPADAADLAFWYGTSMTVAKRWLAATEGCVSFELDGRTLWCPEEDLQELGDKPPATSRWPVRLLGRFDPLVLATKDKSWLIDEEHYKKVWRPSAHVEAVLLARGRIAGTWRYDRKAGGLHVRVSPFDKLPATVVRAAEKQAAGVAAFQGQDLARFEVA